MDIGTKFQIKHETKIAYVLEFGFSPLFGACVLRFGISVIKDPLTEA